MKEQNKLGIWMDHASAHLTEFTVEPSVSTTVSSKYTHDENEHHAGRGEFMMHTKEQHQNSEFYKKLGERIKNYSEVVLFGPTDAKVELFNLLKADHTFNDIKIEVMPADKMTENQQHAFVRKHFSKH